MAQKLLSATFRRMPRPSPRNSLTSMGIKTRAFKCEGSIQVDGLVEEVKKKYGSRDVDIDVANVDE